MLDVAALAAALAEALPTSSPAQQRALALALLTATLDSDVATRQLAEPALVSLLRSLTARSQPITGGGAIVSFGHDNDQRNATITLGDVAGGSIIKAPITLTIPITQTGSNQYAHGSGNIQATGGSTINVYYAPPPPGVPAPPKLSPLLPGVSEHDTLLFKALCEISLAENTKFLHTALVETHLQHAIVQPDSLQDSLQILADSRYISLTKTFAGIVAFQITTYGFEQYAIRSIPDFSSLLIRTLQAIVNQQLKTNTEIEAFLNQSPMLVEYILDILAAHRSITIAKALGRHISVNHVTAQGRRAARDGRFDEEES